MEGEAFLLRYEHSGERVAIFFQEKQANWYMRQLDPEIEKIEVSVDVTESKQAVV